MPSAKITGLRICVSALSVLLTLGAVVHAQRIEWETLNDEVVALSEQGNFDRAIVVAKKALQIAEQSTDLGDDIEMSSLVQLALQYEGNGQYDLAKTLLRRALSISEKLFGLDNTITANCLIMLARQYDNLEEYAFAEPLIRRALAIMEKALGPEHLDIVTPLDSLAMLYFNQKQYARAEPLVKRALTIQEKALGQNDPAVASSLDDLAVLYRAQKQYALAEPLFKRALKIREEALGPDNADVGISLNGLALVYAEQGELSSAEPLFKRALTIWEKTLSPDHPALIRIRENLAELYRQTGRGNKAEEYDKRTKAHSGFDSNAWAGVVCVIAIVGWIALALILRAKKRSAASGERSCGSFASDKVVSPIVCGTERTESGVKFACPKCRQSLEAPEDMSGLQIVCPACNQAIEIPKKAVVMPPPLPVNSTVSQNAVQREPNPIENSDSNFSNQQSRAVKAPSMIANRILHIVLNVTGLITIPVQFVSTFLLGIAVRLTFGLLLFPISLVWCCLLYPMLGLSWVCYKVPVLRNPIGILFIPWVVLALTFSALMPSMGEMDSRNVKLMLCWTWPFTYECNQFILRKLDLESDETASTTLKEILARVAKGVPLVQRVIMRVSNGLELDPGI
jgi:tetratricopeptide (TPR) repeat protein